MIPETPLGHVKLWPSTFDVFPPGVFVTGDGFKSLSITTYHLAVEPHPEAIKKKLGLTVFIGNLDIICFPVPFKSSIFDIYMHYPSAPPGIFHSTSNQAGVFAPK